MIRVPAGAGLLIFAGCSSMSITPGSVGVTAREKGCALTLLRKEGV